jgi:predicted O-methyltransferase YrrM
MLLVPNKRLRLVAGVLETANFAYLKLLLKDPQAARSFAGRVFRTYAELGSGVRYWRACSIDALLPPGQSYEINLQYGRYEILSNPVDELAYLALLARATEANRIFEIGTFRGRTALTFALNTADTAIIHTLDLPPDPHQLDGMNDADALIATHADPGADYRGTPVEHKIRQLYGDSRTFDFEPYLGTMDLVFVDGGHDYDIVSSDTRNALRLIHDGGVVIWHDFANYGDYNDVTRAVVELVPRGEVIQLGASQLSLYLGRESPLRRHLEGLPNPR